MILGNLGEVTSASRAAREEGSPVGCCCLLYTSLAEQAALALHNAESLGLQMERRQLDLDLSIASGIQQMLLPSPTATLSEAGALP